MDDRLEKVLLVVLSVTLGVLLSKGYFLLDQDSFCSGYFIESGNIEVSLFENETLDDGSVKRFLGFYRHDDYFCVATKGRSDVEIAETTYHELAHHFAYSQNDHFCGVEG